MKTCYSSKCPNIPYTNNISRPKCFNSEMFQMFQNVSRDSVWVATGFLDTFWLLLRFVIYLIKNIHSYLSKVFSEAPLGEHLSHVGAMQHDLPCESVEWLLHGAGFC